MRIDKRGENYTRHVQSSYSHSRLSSFHSAQAFKPNGLDAQPERTGRADCRDTVSVSRLKTTVRFGSVIIDQYHEVRNLTNRFREEGAVAGSGIFNPDSSFVTGTYPPSEGAGEAWCYVPAVDRRE